MMDNYSGLRTNLTMLMIFMKLQWQMVILQMDIVTELLILICFFVMYQMTAALQLWQVYNN